MLLRPATLDDCPGIAAAHVASWRAAYDGILDAQLLASLSESARAEGWRSVLRAGRSKLTVAEVAGRIAGFVSYGRCRDAGADAAQGEIWALYVDPADWNTGVGRRLLGEAVDDLERDGYRRVSLWVLAANGRARRFYRVAGFGDVSGASRMERVGAGRVEQVEMLRGRDACAGDPRVPG